MHRTPAAIAVSSFLLAMGLLVWQINREPTIHPPDKAPAGVEKRLSGSERTVPTVSGEEPGEAWTQEDPAEMQKLPARVEQVREERRASLSSKPLQDYTPPPKPAGAEQVQSPNAPPLPREEITPKRASRPVNGTNVYSEPEIGDRQEDRRGAAGSEPSALAVPPAPPRRVDRSQPVLTVPTSPLVTSRAPVSIPKPRVVPEGTVLEVRLAEDISTDSNTAGDTFRVILDRDVEVDGEIVFGKGTLLIGTIDAAVKPGRVKGRGQLSFSLTGVALEDRQYRLRTNTIAMEAESTKGRDAATVGATTAIGAVLGAVFGGKKGAAIGGAAGAGAGAGGVLIGRGKAVELAKEQFFSFRLEESVELNQP